MEQGAIRRISATLLGAAVIELVACGGGGGPTGTNGGGNSGGGNNGGGTSPVEMTARAGHGMTYDESRHVTVLFGGQGTEGTSTTSADRNSTWTWNGTAWTRVSTTGPSARHGAALAYDAARQRVVLHGGQSGAFPNETVLTDTWEWDGTSWTRITDTGPSPRVHVRLGYDRARSRVVMYGGFSIATATEFRDIWEWNGSAWVQQPVSGPAGGTAIGVAYDEKAAAFYLFSSTGSGATPVVVMDRWNGTTLTRVNATVPGCGITAASLGASRGGFINTGRCDASGTNEMWRWDGASWVRVSGTGPTPRIEQTVAYDRDRDRVVMFGGVAMPAGNTLLGETWEFDGTSWTRR